MADPKHTDENKALQFYFITNLLNLLIYVYLMVRIFNIGDTRVLTKGIHLYILFGLIIVVTIFRNKAKSTGGNIQNPILSHPIAKILHFSAIGVFILGIVLSLSIFQWGIYLSFFCIPLDIAAIVISYKPFNKNQQEDLLDSDLDLD